MPESRCSSLISPKNLQPQGSGIRLIHAACRRDGHGHWAFGAPGTPLINRDSGHLLSSVLHLLSNRDCHPEPPVKLKPSPELCHNGG